MTTRDGVTGLGVVGDGVTVLTICVVATLAIPSQFVVPGLGGVGTPATVLWLGCGVWWAWERVHRERSEPSSPVVAALVVFLGVAAISFCSALARPAAAAETGVATMTLLVYTAWGGALLLAHDAIWDPARLVLLARRISVAGGALGVLGIIQFVTGRSWVDELQIPGLVPIRAISEGYMRNGFARPAGTAIHPIEYGAVLGMLIPIALSSALASSSGRDGSAWRRWWPTLSIATAIGVSSTRSALIGLLVALVVLAPTWDRVQRLWISVAIVVGSIVVFVTVPGMVGTTLGLFSGLDGDTSVRSRVDQYAVAGDYLSRDLYLGRGPGTFLPRFRIFDNQYLLTAVEIGVIGLAALVALALVAIGCALVSYRRTIDQQVRIVVAGIGAGVVVGSVLLAFFDGFSFPMMPTVWFLLVGMAGASLRSTRVQHVTALGRGGLRPRRRARRRLLPQRRHEADEGAAEPVELPAGPTTR
ncbi:O-antigen ligase family protein [Janibacter melonis]|uniref:O-antigen ligase family protein n=1 Tax=Janibacter melonis TaxID=262209 RepID=UPI00177B2823|nr:O-antigen polymerase [Janibacter melonis]